MEAHRSEERNVSILLPAAGLWVENGYVLSVDCSSELEAFQVQVSRWSRPAEKGNGSDATSSTTGKVGRQVARISKRKNECPARKVVNSNGLAVKLGKRRQQQQRQQQQSGNNNNHQNNNQNLKNGKKSCAACSKRRSSAPTTTSTQAGFNSTKARPAAAGVHTRPAVRAHAIACRSPSSCLYFCLVCLVCLVC